MIVGYRNYVVARKGSGRGSLKSKVFVIRHSPNINTATGQIEVGQIHFPIDCIGKRVRIKVEFVDEEEKSLDMNRKLVEPLSFEVNHY